MPKIVLKGWNSGLRKISLTKLFQERLNLPLKSAKVKTDSLLEGEIFIVQIENSEKAEEFVKAATEIAAVCELIKDND